MALSAPPDPDVPERGDDGAIATAVSITTGMREALEWTATCGRISRPRPLANYVSGVIFTTSSSRWLGLAERFLRLGDFRARMPSTALPRLPRHSAIWLSAASPLSPHDARLSGRVMTQQYIRTARLRGLNFRRRHSSKHILQAALIAPSPSSCCSSMAAHRRCHRRGDVPAPSFSATLVQAIPAAACFIGHHRQRIRWFRCSSCSSRELIGRGLLPSLPHPVRRDTRYGSNMSGALSGRNQVIVRFWPIDGAGVHAGASYYRRGLYVLFDNWRRHCRRRHLPVPMRYGVLPPPSPFGPLSWVRS